MPNVPERKLFLSTEISFTCGNGGAFSTISLSDISSLRSDFSFAAFAAAYDSNASDLCQKLLNHKTTTTKKRYYLRIVIDLQPIFQFLKSFGAT